MTDNDTASSNPQSAELDALLREGAALAREDIRESAVRVAESVKNPKDKEAVKDAVRVELDRIDIDEVSQKTAGVVVASMILAYNHHNGELKDSWTSPSAFIDSSWRESVDWSDPDWEAIKAEAERKTSVNIGYAILTMAMAILSIADDIDKESVKKNIPFGTLWSAVFVLESVVKSQGFGPNGQRADQITDAASAESYGAESYILQSAIGGYIGYVTMDDINVRNNHQKLHKRAWPANNRVWNTIYPPNGHKCRCRTVSIKNAETAKQMGYKVMQENKIPPGGKPDPGYSNNPQNNPFEPNFSLVPKWMTKALGITILV